MEFSLDANSVHTFSVEGVPANFLAVCQNCRTVYNVRESMDSKDDMPCPNCDSKESYRINY